MHVQRIQYQSRVSWPQNPSGYYYWTNQYYCDVDNPPEDNSSLYWGSVFMLRVHTTAVQLNWVRVLDPANTDTVVFDGPAFDQPGIRAIDDGYSPFDCVLMRWLIGGRQVGYSRLRLPVHAVEESGGLLSPGLVSTVEGIANDVLLHGKITSKDGVLIEEFRVAPWVHMWQFRHGTKRRERLIVPN